VSTITASAPSAAVMDGPQQSAMAAGSPLEVSEKNVLITSAAELPTAEHAPRLGMIGELRPAVGSTAEGGADCVEITRGPDVSRGGGSCPAEQPSRSNPTSPIPNR
jgi:hypothetical protein